MYNGHFSLLKNIHIWNIDINDLVYNNSLSYIDLLSNLEKEKFFSFKFKEDKMRYTISHIALREIISYYTGVHINCIKFKYNEYHKPYIANNISLYFNLSHSHEKALIAISNNEIGVDIEYIKNSFDILELVNIVFSDEEHENFLKLKESDQQIKYFYTIWTKKESYLKAISVGLLYQMNEVNVNGKNKSIISSKFNNDKKYFVQIVESNHSNYSAAVCYEGNEFKNILQLHYSNLFDKEKFFK